MELKAAISDRDCVTKKQQALGEEMEKIRAMLAFTQDKWVLYGVLSLLFIVHYGSVVWSSSQ